jgi:phenylacetate-CoA ligase
MSTTLRSATSQAPDTAAFAAYRDRLQRELVPTLPGMIARLGWDRPRIVAHQGDRLRVLLAHAAEHSPFHASRLAGIDPDALDPRDLSSLPVMTKAEMMGRFDDVVTDRRVSLRLVEETLHGTRSLPRPILDEYVAFTSGGSSGRRGIYVLDRPALRQFLGSLSRGLVARIEQAGGPPPGGLAIAMIGAASAVHPTGGAAALAGGRLPFHFVPVPVTRPVAEIVARLNALQPPLLYGYPSVLARLATEQRSARLRVCPRMITTTSETLTPPLRRAIREGFGVPIVDAFGSTEGLVGTSAPDDETVVFAEDGCIVELVDERHRPVAPGTPSATVLITNLENHVLPLIRYELTDVVIAESGGGHLRGTVQGRADETFRFGDLDLDPHVARSVLVQTPEVAEYQVRQTVGGLDVTVVPGDLAFDPSALVDGLADRLRSALADAGLPRADVGVTLAPLLERDVQTGKLRRFVPL